jgi:hypothetical protein
MFGKSKAQTCRFVADLRFEGENVMYLNAVNAVTTGVLVLACGLGFVLDD